MALRLVETALHEVRWVFEGEQRFEASELSWLRGFLEGFAAAHDCWPDTIHLADTAHLAARQLNEYVSAGEEWKQVRSRERPWLQDTLTWLERELSLGGASSTPEGGSK